MQAKRKARFFWELNHMNIEDQLTAAFSAPKPQELTIPSHIKDVTGYLIAREFRSQYPADKVFMKNGSREAVQMSEWFDGL